MVPRTKGPKFSVRSIIKSKGRSTLSLLVHPALLVASVAIPSMKQIGSVDVVTRDTPEQSPAKNVAPVDKNASSSQKDSESASVESIPRSSEAQMAGASTAVFDAGSLRPSRDRLVLKSAPDQKGDPWNERHMLTLSS